MSAAAGSPLCSVDVKSVIVSPKYILYTIDDFDTLTGAAFFIQLLQNKGGTHGAGPAVLPEAVYYPGIALELLRHYRNVTRYYEEKVSVQKDQAFRTAAKVKEEEKKLCLRKSLPCS